MDRLRLARILVTLLALFLAIIPAVADLNASHVANPLWIGHARLHTVWLICTNSLVMIVASSLMWTGPLARRNVLLASSLVGAVLLGFFVAAATQPLYGGALADPNGVQLQFGPLDANVAGFGVCALLLAVAVSRAWNGSPADAA